MKFGAACAAAGLLLVPMVVEVFGCWGARSEEAMQLVTKGCASRAGLDGAAAGGHLHRSLSVTLQRLNARILLARVDPRSEIFEEPVPIPQDEEMRLCADEVADLFEGMQAPSQGL